MTNFVNLTPHTINIVTSEGTLAFAPSGTVARVQAENQFVGYCENQVALYRTKFGEVINLPDPDDNIIFLVSALVRTAASERPDIASPGDLVRDDAGNVIGCKGLILNN